MTHVCDDKVCGHTITLPPDRCPECGRNLCLEKNQDGEPVRLHCASEHDGIEDHTFEWRP